MSTGTSISQKATASISAPNGSGSRALVGDMPEHEWPLSEQCRVAGDAWVTLDHEARLLEATKDIELAERIADLGNVPVTKAERMVKATGSWREHVELIVAARTAANRAKNQMNYLEKRFYEVQSRDAKTRVEMKLAR